MSALQQIKNSYVYLGSGSYQHLRPVVTQKGLEAGWKITYPEMLNLNGVNFSKFTSLDSLLADGLIELKSAVSTVV